ncbi:MAG: tetratricopeptide repeat protein [Terriglobia bacterium]
MVPLLAGPHYNVSVNRRESVASGKARRRYVLLLAGVALFVLMPAARGQSPADLERRGIEALKSGHLGLAERTFHELARQDPSGETFGYLAAVEGRRREYAQAIIDFHKAIQLGNDTPTVRFNLALSYLYSHKLELGIRELRVALAKDPTFVAARYALGLAVLDSGQAREALTDLEQVRTPLSKHPEMWANLVRAEFAVGNTEKALQTVDEATATIPNDSHLAAALARLCLDHQQPQKARELLENAIEAAPNNSALKLLLAEASLEAEEPEEALAVLENIPPGAGGPGQLAFLRGKAFLLGGNPAEAAPLLASAIAADPQNVDYLSTYAELQSSRRNYAGALTTLERIQQMRPNDPEFTYKMALVYVFARKYAQAITKCQEVTRMDPQFDQAYFLIGAIQFDRGDLQVAEQAFGHALAIRHGSALYRSALGAALFKEGNLEASRRELDRALLLDPRTAAAYYWRARSFAHQNEPKKALADLEAFVVLEPNYPEAYEFLSHLYTEDGQVKKASAAAAKYKALKQIVGQHPPFFLVQVGQLKFRLTHAEPQ